MDKYYSQKKDNESEDLSGCLSSGFLGKQPDRISKATVRQQPANDNSGDLSGCLASGFLGKQTKNIAKVPPPPPRKSFSPPSDDDLSGCLASGFLGKPAHHTTPQSKPAVASKDEDLSGCLASGFLQRIPSDPTPTKTRDLSGDLAGSRPGGFRTSQIAPRASKIAQTSAEAEPDDSPASDWFYTN
jgi:hypothetical protein